MDEISMDSIGKIDLEKKHDDDEYNGPEIK